MQFDSQLKFGLMLVAIITTAAAGGRHMSDPAPAETVAPGAIRSTMLETDLRDLIGQARVGALDAVKTALADKAGKAVEVELETHKKDDKTMVVWVVDIVLGEQLHEVVVSAMDGKIVVSSVDDDMAELRGFKTALRHAELDLGALIGKAEGYVKGHVVAAGLEYDDEGPVCEVVFANGRCLIEAEVEARAGHLVEIELRPEHGDDDDEGNEGDEEHEDHGQGHRRMASDDDDDDDDHADHDDDGDDDDEEDEDGN